jgi:S1-C subfamily serine protease
MLNIRIKAGKKDLGGAFALNPTTVVTANHVVRDRAAGELRVIPNDTEQFTVKTVEQDESLDAAVLILDEGIGPHSVLAVGKATEGERWKVEAQPLGNDPVLTGEINATRREYTNNGGY